MKNLRLIVPVVALLVILSGCTAKTPEGMPDDPPDIKVDIEGEEVEYLTVKQFWNQAAFSTSDSFFTLVKNNPDPEFLDAKDGDTVNVEFIEWIPNKVLVEKVFLNEKLEEAYIKNDVSQVKVKLDDGKTSFDIDSEGRELLGYRITANWGENQGEYSFVVNIE